MNYIIGVNMTTEIMNLDEVYAELKKRKVQINDIYQYSNRYKTKNKLINLSLGRIWINLLMPETFPLINEPVDKKRMGTLITELITKFNANVAASIMTSLNIEAFKLSSIIPQSINHEELIVPQDIIDERNQKLNINTPLEKYSDELKTLSTKYVKDKLDPDSGLSNIINSGAKISALDLGVLQLSKGPTVDIEGNISDPITSSLAEGYTGPEYYAAAADARRTLFIRAVGTAEPGYLAKTVIFANSNTKLDSDDCGTNKFLELFIKPGMERHLYGRFMVNSRSGKLVEITPDSDIVNKVIQLRSPTYCKAKDGICKVCYGKLAEKLNTKHIGLLSGSAINTAGLAGFSMKARHKSVSVEIKDVDFTRDIM